MKRIVSTLLLVGVACTTTRAEDAALAAPLAAKGVKLKKEKNGTVTEISFGSDVKMTLEDYQLVGRLHNLRRANLGANDLPLNDQTAPLIAPLDQLEHFFSNGAEMTDDGMKAFAGWKELRYFGLDHWGWKVAAKGTVGPGLAHLAALPHLEVVRLGGCRIDNRATAALAQVKTLQSIDLGHCYAVTDEGIAALKALPHLRVIKLSPQYSPRITDAALVPLGDIKTLEEIHLAETWLTYDKGFTHLKKLPALKKLVLTNVVATDADIAKLKADHPHAAVQWTSPDEATTEKTKATFRKHWEKKEKK